MEKQENQFNLLNGTFTRKETKEILVTLFTNKIQFHRLKNFSHEERFGKSDPHAVERIPELKKTLEEILSLLERNGEESQFEIHADIKLKVVK